MSVLSVRLHDPFLFMRFKEKAKREGLTVSELLTKLIAESLEEKKVRPSDNIFILRESLRILTEVKAMIDKSERLWGEDKPKIAEFLNTQIRDLQRKFQYEKSRC